MSVRAFGRVAENVGEADVGGEVGPADEGGTRPGVGSLVLPTAQAELQEETATPDVAYEGGFGGDEGLVVDVVEEGGFEDLGHGERPLDDGEGDVGVDDSALWDST